MANIESRRADDGTLSYRVKVRLKGHAAASATFTRLTDARRWAQATEVAIRVGRHFKTSEAKRHTVAELVDRYVREVLPHKPKNASNTKQQLLWWKSKIGQTTVSVRRTHLDSTGATLKDRVHLTFVWTRWQATRWWAGGNTAKS